MIELLMVDPSQPEIKVFDHLLQLYEYEFSDITKLEVNRQGLYTNQELEKNLAEHTCQPILLRFKKKWAGLAVVNLKSYLSDDPHVRDIAEFFVMKIYRKRHLGQEMAHELFNLFPGKWEIRQLPEAKEARAFWLKVLDRFFEGRFTDQHVEHPRFKGHMQTFESVHH